MSIQDKLLETSKNIAATQMNKAVDYLIPNLDTLSEEEAKQQLYDKATKVATVMQDLAKDPEVQKLILESGEAFATLTGELMNAVEEPVLELTDQSLNLLKQIAVNSGSSLSKTGVDVVMSVLGEIPGVGGLVDLGFTALVAFNGLAKNIMISADNVSKMATIANKLTGEALNPIEDGIDAFERLKDRAEGIYSNIDKKLETLSGAYLGEQPRAEIPPTPPPPYPGEERLKEPEQPASEISNPATYGFYKRRRRTFPEYK